MKKSLFFYIAPKIGSLSVLERKGFCSFCYFLVISILGVALVSGDINSKEVTADGGKEKAETQS